MNECRWCRWCTCHGCGDDQFTFSLPGAAGFVKKHARCGGAVEVEVAEEHYREVVRDMYDEALRVVGWP